MSRPRKNKKQAEVVPVWRFYFIVAALLTLLALLVGRVLLLQVLDTDRGHEFLQKQGAMRSLRTAEIPAYRGLVSDRRGEPLAVSTPVISLWANPRHLDTTRLPELAGLLNLQLSDLQARVDRYAGKRFMYLERHMVPARARDILARRIPGVSGEREYRRYYPSGEVAAQVVGFTNVDGEGIAGLELAYNDWLRGIPGKKKYIKDLHGDAVRDIGVLEAAQPGRDLKLSIDLRLQYLQHRELQRAMTVTGAKSGSIVTLDAATGEILAMVNHPVYNPNSQDGFEMANTRNRAMTDVYEPGSTMKPLTLVAALESGKYSTETMIDTAPGWINVGRKTLPDPRNYGEISVSRVIEKSSQVGVTKMAQVLGHEPIWGVFQRFGMGSPVGVGFPGESAGILPDRPRWRAIEKVTLAFGYGLTATPLQIAHAYSVFANDGVQMPLTLLARDDSVEAPLGQRVIAADTARKVVDVLHAVTGEHGTAGKARVAGYEVGGKTGTVHKVGPQGYIDDKYVALFAGLAPVEDPRFVIVVVIDQPQGDAYGGGAAAAPVFSRVAEGALRLLNVPPTVPAEGIAKRDKQPGGNA
ncbi:peptidoglycan D,D-transpeptidase FtsI family protein [Halioglobus pacificus]|uniref:Peptidoglycan D,D-transpeptidase FtsI n=1 Tax=Parahalioglobus pacificus TaxID=930806 RepID=A0A918XDB2_9GAMM|nr:penicillin-binding transpeptidase domain-containing protein [Halioglobus pacificus]GHD25945.1 penicillin-binding protein 3 [Halioglobus pacificus]